MDQQLRDLLRQVRAMAARMPRGTVAAELSTCGPLLYLVVGGRRGVARYRDGVLLDEAQFIPLYRRAYGAALAGAPGEGLLLRQVDRAMAHDRRENAHLLAAFDLLDPGGQGQRPRILVATRHTAPAAGHAVVKFALLALPTAAGLAAVARRR